MKSIKYIVLGILIGVISTFFISKNLNKKTVEEDAEVVIERIKSVNKLIDTEGYFSELYNYKDADRYFYDLIEFEKKHCF